MNVEPTSLNLKEMLWNAGCCWQQVRHVRVRDQHPLLAGVCRPAVHVDGGLGCRQRHDHHVPPALQWNLQRNLGKSINLKFHDFPLIFIKNTSIFIENQ